MADAASDAVDVTTGSGTGYSYTCIDGSAGALVAQAAGKVVVAGDSRVVRLLPSGSVDTTFGAGGATNLATSTMAASVAAAITLDSGAILVGGRGGLSNGLVARLTADGAIDTTFGSGGFDYPKAALSGPTFIYALAATSSHVFAGGLAAVGAGKTKALLLRYSPSGVLENTFGFHFDEPVDMGLAQNSRLLAMALQADGKLVVAGLSLANSGVARFLADGTLDATFGTSGKMVFQAGTSTSSITSVAIQSTGAIVVAGTSDAGAFVARLTTAGALDTTFGSGGIVHVGTLGRRVPLRMQPDDAFTVAWDQTHPIDVMRRSKDSALDATFGSGGALSSSFGGATGQPFALIRSDGKLTAGVALDGFPARECVVRYDTVVP
jgi:uncharacterized delta-60 repeat protein